jgi:hypothetical protein
MTDAFDCDGRAWDYLAMAETETDQTLREILFSMWRGWLLLGQLERMDPLRNRDCCHGARPRTRPSPLTVWIFTMLVRAEAGGGRFATRLCRLIRGLLWERLRRRRQRSAVRRST